MVSSTFKSFNDRLYARWAAVNSCAAAGIDPDIALIPDDVWNYVGGRTDLSVGVTFFCQEIIKATAPYVCAYKVQPAFFSRLGEAGERSLKNVLEYLHSDYPDIPIVMDGKISDITNTVDQYVTKIFDVLQADAILVNPLMGSDTVLPFATRADKGVFILCKTSNPTSTEILDLTLLSGEPMWRKLVELSMEKWNANKNIGIVLSAHAPNDLVGIREIIGDSPILLAGVGAQGGDPRPSIRHVMDQEGYGFFVPSSRGIMFAKPDDGETFAGAAARSARSLRDEINQFRSK